MLCAAIAFESKGLNLRAKSGFNNNASCTGPMRQRLRLALPLGLRVYPRAHHRACFSTMQAAEGEAEQAAKKGAAVLESLFSRSWFGSLCSPLPPGPAAMSISMSVSTGSATPTSSWGYSFQNGAEPVFFY